MAQLSYSRERALDAKRLLAKETDDEIYRYIDKHDKGITQYDLMKALGWSAGKVQGALFRLHHDGLIYHERLVTSVRIKLLWFPRSEEDIYKELQ